VGILGGTFNPPHLGHIAVASHALAELGLERVLLMPAGVAPHKAAAPDPGPRHRLSMCRLAVEGSDGLSACGMELDREGPSYTVDTLTSIHATHPDARLTFIVGADTAETLPAWREPARVLALAELAVATRAGSPREHVLETLEGLTAARVSFLAMPALEVSSSDVRERVARGESVDDLVGARVAGYIAEHGLYASTTERAAG
jgi:nicotinate-nucleotide adenylyltransferase